MKIIFSRRPGNLISWLIRSWIKKPYSHTAIEINLYDVSLIFESSFNGVDIVTKKDFLKKNLIVNEYSLGVNIEEKYILKYMFEHIDSSFSFMSFVGIVLGNKTIGEDGEKNMICSEFVARAIGMKGKDLDHASPKDVEDYIKDKIS